MAKGKRERQEGAIKRLEKTIALHEANATLTKDFNSDNVLLGTPAKFTNKK